MAAFALTAPPLIATPRCFWVWVIDVARIMPELPGSLETLRNESGFTTQPLALPSTSIRRVADLPSSPAEISKATSPRARSRKSSRACSPAGLAAVRIKSSANAQTLTLVSRTGSRSSMTQSVTALNRCGDIGSPCLTPLPQRILSLRSPPTWIIV